MLYALIRTKLLVNRKMHFFYHCKKNRFAGILKQNSGNLINLRYERKGK